MYSVLSGSREAPFVEVRRSDKKTADEDVAIFRWLGKPAWVEEESSAVNTKAAA